MQISMETQKSKRFILLRKKYGQEMQREVTLELGFKNEKDFTNEAIPERNSGKR